MTAPPGAEGHDVVGSDDAEIDLTTMGQFVSAIGRRLHTGDRLGATAEAVALAAVELTGFGAVALNVRREDGDYEIAAVAGSDAARAALLGQVVPAASWDVQRGGSEAWGGLQFVSHERQEARMGPAWVPDAEPIEGAEAWHPLDALYAPITDADGDEVGILSVDLPEDGVRPGTHRRALLEAFAVQAGLALAAARRTEQLQARQAELDVEHARLGANEAAFRLAFERSATATALVSIEAGDHGRVLQANESFCRVAGLAPDEIVGRRISDALSAGLADRALSVLAQVGVGMPRQRIERRITRRDGTTVWASILLEALDPGPPLRPFALVEVEDIGERRRREALLEHQAGHDDLTALANRRLLVTRVDRAVARVAAGGHPGYLLLGDLDAFKELNDRLGHAAGDAALREIAGRLRAEVRPRDTVARLGGDEFVVLAEQLDDEGAEALRARLANAVGRPLSGSGWVVGVSIGTARISGGSLSAQELLEQADRSMYLAKAGRLAPRQ